MNYYIAIGLCMFGIIVGILLLIFPKDNKNLKVDISSCLDSYVRSSIISTISIIAHSAASSRIIDDYGKCKTISDIEEYTLNYHDNLQKYVEEYENELKELLM